MEIKIIFFGLKGVVYKIKNNPLFLIEYLKKVYFYFTYDITKIKKIYSKYNYLTLDETFSQMINKKKSILRFGDGELEILLGGSIYAGAFKQSYSKDLKEKLLEILNYGIKKDNVLICMPHTRLSKNYGKTLSWYYAQNNFYKFFKPNYSYGDSFIFRDLNENKKKELLSFLKNKKKILYISNSRNIEIFKKLKLNNVEHSICKPNESYSQLDLLKNEIESFISKNKKHLNESIILISSGVVSKVLIYKYSSKVQMVDFGNIQMFKSLKK